MGGSATCEWDRWEDQLPVNGTDGRICYLGVGQMGGSATCEWDRWEDLAEVLPDAPHLVDSSLHVGPLAHQHQEHDGSL